ncbi:MAG: hypothetical protein S4CHLAM2_07720 [Chlamydiales bacterium]|nr:hypothetical protein [Chlamydiales bacterium]
MQHNQLVVEINGQMILFGVKYPFQAVQKRAVPGLTEIALQKTEITEGYVVTKSPNDFGPLESQSQEKKCMKMPAALFCYWLGESEFVQKNLLLS